MGVTPSSLGKGLGATIDPDWKNRMIANAKIVKLATIMTLLMICLSFFPLLL